MSADWIRLHRELNENESWLNTTPAQKVIFVTVLLSVNDGITEQEWNGQMIEVHPGQMITSLLSLAKKCGGGINSREVKKALERLEEINLLVKWPIEYGWVITVLDWWKYQAPMKNLCRKEGDNGERGQ